MDSLILAIWISNVCHRHCDQCYSDQVLPHGKMEAETARDIANWIKRIAGEENVRNLQISFLGGEPTNNISTVFELADLLGEAGHKVYEGTGIRYVLYTNGDLLDSEMMWGLKDRRMVIGLNPTDDSFEEIERKIAMIKKNIGACYLPVALNEFNLSRLEGLARLAVRNRCHVRTNRLYHGGTIHGYVGEYRKQMGKMLKIFIDADSPIWPNWIMESTMPTHKGQKNPCLCGKRFGVIDVDGTIRSCNPDQDTKIGNIYTTEHWEDLKFPQRWSAKNLPECQGCEWIVWCQGGCPYTRKLAYGTYDYKSPFCSAFKELFPLLMKLKEKWLVSQNRREIIEISPMAAKQISV